MNSSIFSVSKMHIAFAFIALCAMVLAPLAEVKAQAAPATATLTVEKEVVIDGMATTSVPYTDFSFLINGTNETDFDADGSVDVQVATGTPITITETAAAGYVTTYTNCSNITLASPTSTATCTITNTASSTGGGAPQTGHLVIQKVIMGTTSASADDFSFDLDHVGTTNGDENNVAFDVDGVTYEVSTGVYSVVENDPGANFTVSYDATSTDGIGWVLDDCNMMLVTANATTTCTITNTATSTGGTGTTTPETGVLVVNKEVAGGNSATSSFSFRINGGPAIAFEADGSNRITLATGTYAITEVAAANYTPTYSNCMAAVITANATTTCTITNNFNVGGGQLYEITGIVWDDEDEDGVLDGSESRLENWTVSAEQTGEVTRTDVTDANGRYTLLVTDGDWLVSQTTQADWDQTFPAGGTHTVNATGTATTTIVLGDYNFGNDRDSSGGGGGGGNGVRIELRDNDDDDDDDDDNNSGGGRTDDDDDDDDDQSGAPGGQVLGESTSVYPYGAPNTGMGGGHKMDGSKTLPLMTLVLASLIGLGFIRSIRDDEELT